MRQFEYMQTFFSKLLLFGEHTVNLGSPALAMPFELYSGYWVEGNGAGKQQDLFAYARYLYELEWRGSNILKLDTDAILRDLQAGKYFESSAPAGYGVGSSGILTAALYERYGKEKPEANYRNFTVLKSGFAQMESFFHGTSSGLDPLISYLNEPLLITAQGVTTVSLPSYLNPGNAIFIINTGIRRKAETLIHWFLQKTENQSFREKLQGELVEYNKAAIHSFLEGHWTKLMQSCHEISAFQFEELSPLIPDDYKNIWEKGLAGDDYKLKICGAGGGGFIMGVTKDIEKAKTLLQQYDVTEVFPEILKN